MEWNLGRIGKCELSLGFFREQIVDELLARVLMRRTRDQHGGIGYDEATYLIRTLVWINHRHRLALIHPTHDVVAVDQAEGELTARHQIGAVAIARGYLDTIFVQAVHECAGALIAQKSTKSAAIWSVVVPKSGFAITVLPRQRGSEYENTEVGFGFSSLRTMSTRALAAKPVQ